MSWPPQPEILLVLANDTAPDAQGLKISSVADQGANGTIQITADQRAIVFTPNAGHSSGQFAYTARDSAGQTASATVTLMEPGAVFAGFTYDCQRQATNSTGTSGGNRCTLLAQPNPATGVQRYVWSFVHNGISYTRNTTEPILPEIFGQPVRRDEVCGLTVAPRETGCRDVSATLQVRWHDGRVSTTSQNIRLRWTPPSVVWERQGLGHDVTAFLVSGVWEDGFADKVYSYHFDFDVNDGLPPQAFPYNGVTQFHSESKLAHSYPRDGQYEVAVVIRERNSTVQYVLKEWLDVKNHVPEPVFQVVGEGDGKTFTFDPLYWTQGHYWMSTVDEAFPDRWTWSPPGPDGTTREPHVDFRSYAFFWDFGDGTYEQGTFDDVGRPKAVRHVFTTPGDRKVKLSVTDERGATGEYSYGVPVTDHPPAASLVAQCETRVDASGIADCRFDAEKSTDDVGIEAYEWNLAGHVDVTTSPTYSLRFLKEGAWEVMVRALEKSTRRPSAWARRVINVSAASPPQPLRLFTVPPCRVFDSRQSAKLASGSAKTIAVTGAPCGIPASAGLKAVTANLTVLDGTGSGHLFAYAPGTAVPVAAALNFPSGDVRGNSATIPVSNGSIAVLPSVAQGASTAAAVHVLVDITGFYSTDNGAPAPATGPYALTVTNPCRVFTTQPNAALGGGETRMFRVASACVPDTARAAILNVVAVPPSSGGHLRVSPSNATPASVTSVNFGANATVANGTTVGLARGTADLAITYGSTSATASAHALIDSLGYFAEAGLRYYPIQPCRILDTREARFGHSGPLSDTSAVRLQVQGNCGVPRGARAALINAVVVGTTGAGHVSFFLPGQGPAVGHLPFAANESALALHTVVPLGPWAEEDVLADAFLPGPGTTTGLVVDVHGYYADPASLSTAATTSAEVRE
jgi:PKD domain/Bacterial Ig domain